MVTLNPARALGLAGRLGELRPGAGADLIAVPAPERNEELFESLLHHSSRVAASLIGGEWAILPEA
jgi:imidazolonepropionase-like amidohydrolase